MKNDTTVDALMCGIDKETAALMGDKGDLFVFYDYTATDAYSLGYDDLGSYLLIEGDN